MNTLLDRLAALDAARTVTASAILLILLIEAAWVVSAVTGHLVSQEMAAALAAAALALTALLYKR